MNQGESKCNNDYSYDVYLDENYLLQLMNQGESKCNTVTISEKCTYSIIVAIDESGRE
jgi:hypothetical protein